MLFRSHYFWNNGQYNLDDFYFQDVVQAIKRLQEVFKVDPTKCKVNNLEFAVNLSTDFDPDDFIKDLLYYLGNHFHPMTRVALPCNEDFGLTVWTCKSINEEAISRHHRLLEKKKEKRSVNG